MTDTETKHGPEEAGYDNMGRVLTGLPSPWIRCLCGFETSRGCHFWSDVGEEFDEHLEGVREGVKA